MTESAASASIDSPSFVRSRPRSRFFLIVSIACFLLLLAGFSQTFFLKALFDTPTLPVYVHVHGWIWTAWFGLLLGQTWLIESGNVRLHRRLGIAGVALAVLMVLYGLLVLYLRIMKYHDPSRDLSLSGTTSLVWANLNLLTAFAVFVSLAVYFRHRADTHKRLMLLATFSMMGQPLGRLAHIEAFQFSQSQFLNEIVYGLGGLFVLLLSLIVYDVLIRGRPHPASAIGAPLMIGSVFLSATVVPQTRMGQGLILIFG